MYSIYALYKEYTTIATAQQIHQGAIYDPVWCTNTINPFRLFSTAYEFNFLFNELYQPKVIVNIGKLDMTV